MILSRDVWERARAAPQDRDPDGRALAKFRWAVVEGGVVVFPRHALSRGTDPAVLAQAAWETGVPARARAFAFWFAHAARQELWRRMRARPGFLPVIAVRAEGNVVALDAAGIDAGPVRPLADELFRDAPHWLAWAEAKAS